MRAGRVVTYWFGLVVLYTVVTRADAASGVLGYTTAVTRRLSSPDLALIPRNTAAAPPAGEATGTLSSGAAYVPGSGTDQAAGAAADALKRRGETGSTLVAPGQIPLGGTR